MRALLLLTAVVANGNDIDLSGLGDLGGLMEASNKFQELSTAVLTCVDGDVSTTEAQQAAAKCMEDKKAEINSFCEQNKDNATIKQSCDGMDFSDMPDFSGAGGDSQPTGEVGAKCGNEGGAKGGETGEPEDKSGCAALASTLLFAVAGAFML